MNVPPSKEPRASNSFHPNAFNKLRALFPFERNPYGLARLKMDLLPSRVLITDRNTSLRYSAQVFTAE